ncbi:sensor histidine kinase [Marivirga harenae]|uniref:sensor histidine kinase n=1 Tax=Marivirga harenae TaxID=2010992 RepID=UPI0026DF3B42|nr:ATP-binding protein [Marivirga harenae]WKV10570.1 ATP-binding protein [Marivirga harenae]
MAYLLFESQNYLAPTILLGLLVIQFFGLLRFLNATNYKLVRFLESVRYSDFTSSFGADNSMGKSYKEINLAFNEVADAFKQTRAEKEQNLLIISAVLQNIQTGIIQFDNKGEIGIINTMTKKLLLTPQIKHLNDIKKSRPEIHQRLIELKPGKNELIDVNSEIKLSINCSLLRMGEKDWKIVSIQNIYTELQQNELDAWQNLTKVLRHEIMNSITPIATLVGSLTDILREDGIKMKEGYLIPEESQEDLKLGLKTIENRSRGLINFINAYRDYTSIPSPKFEKVNSKQLIQYVSRLLSEELNKANIKIDLQLPENEVEIWADEEQIQLILINLIKNARESLYTHQNPKITIKLIVAQKNTYINVEDNGQGIVPEAIERIFIPFFTTKKDGSGIGLSLSRQIMQLHNGKLNVVSKPGELTSFSMQFPKASGDLK